MRKIALTVVSVMLFICAHVHGESENRRSYGNCSVRTDRDMFDDTKGKFAIVCVSVPPRYALLRRYISMHIDGYFDGSFRLAFLVSQEGANPWLHSQPISVRFRFDSGAVFEGEFVANFFGAEQDFDSEQMSRILVAMANAKTVAVEVDRIYRQRIQLDGSREAVRDFLNRLKLVLPSSVLPKMDL